MQCRPRHAVCVIFQQRGVVRHAPDNHPWNMKLLLPSRRVAFAFACLLAFNAPVSAQQPATEEVGEVLTSGPMHEAFAATISFDPVAGLVVNEPPPALIEEVPPDHRPAGSNVTWIPGYWAWDSEREEFIWVSGVWRNLPPGRQWVPGYWNDLGGRYQWTSGYWEAAEVTEVRYLPAPPRSLETGPNIAAPSVDHHWVPGNWVYDDTRYTWRAGYWAPARANWVWVPAHYCWTPRGYVYVDGYWDYPVVNRGVLFAPVRFDSGYRTRHRSYFTPSVVISLNLVLDHLFVRPSYGHYYYGDYYENRYRDRGYFPSFSFFSGRRGYDPIYAYSRWEHRHDRDWDRRRREAFEHRRDHAGFRPPRTWSVMRDGEAGERRDGSRFAERYDRIARERGDAFRVLDRRERQRFESQREGLRTFARQRQDRESRGGRSRTNDSEGANDQRIRIERSPVASSRSSMPNRDRSAPPRLQERPSKPGKTEADRRPSPGQGSEGVGRRGDSPRGHAAPGRRADADTDANRERANPPKKADPRKRADRSPPEKRPSAERPGVPGIQRIKPSPPARKPPAESRNRSTQKRSDGGEVKRQTEKRPAARTGSEQRSPERAAQPKSAGLPDRDRARPKQEPKKPAAAKPASAKPDKSKPAGPGQKRAESESKRKEKDRR